jgi:hypothetical protein
MPTVLMLAVVSSLSFAPEALTSPHRLVVNNLPNRTVRGALLTSGNLSPGQGADPAKVAAAIKANAQALRSSVLQKTLISEQPPPDSSSSQPTGGGLRGRARQKIVEKKTGEFKDMMEGIASPLTTRHNQPIRHQPRSRPFWIGGESGVRAEAKYTRFC